MSAVKLKRKRLSPLRQKLRNVERDLQNTRVELGGWRRMCLSANEQKTKALKECDRLRHLPWRQVVAEELVEYLDGKLTLPSELWIAIRDAAERDDVSVREFVTLALGRHLSSKDSAIQ